MPMWFVVLHSHTTSKLFFRGVFKLFDKVGGAKGRQKRQNLKEVTPGDLDFVQPHYVLGATSLPLSQHDF